MRLGVLAAVIVLAGACGAATARADDAGTTTTTAASTTSSTTTSPTAAPLPGSRLPGSCVGAGAAAIEEPGRRILALGTPASSLGASAYPDDAPFVSFASSTASGSTCRSAQVVLGSVSLFGGTVTATSVQATGGKGSVTGLEIDGQTVAAASGRTLSVDGWGRLTLGAQVGRLSAPLVLRLLSPRASLPAGTTIAVAFAAASLPPPPTHAKKAPSRPEPQQSRPAAARATPAHASQKHRRRKHDVPQPLKWTPRLGLNRKRYVFPVSGGASYVDTYGANRSDIYDGWHHGDDLFAPLGTPVVAVARGTLSLVGWNRLGGWRLWLTDRAGNSFYYAHLAGYSHWILRHRHVKAGQVVGFLGRTGDAFTTTPHLHFEIHPHQLLKLGYDGAVDPTRYLRKWRVERVSRQDLPRPARLRAPAGAPAEEARVVWHQLLVARHLLRPSRAAPAVAVGAAIRRPFPPGPVVRHLAAVPLAAHVGPSSRSYARPTIAFGAGALVLAGLAAIVVRRRRRAPAPGGQPPLH